MSQGNRDGCTGYFLDLKERISAECSEPEFILPYLEEIEKELGEEIDSVLNALACTDPLQEF